MRRPCFLVLDREFPGSISTRKLVIESAKLNVITAYNPDEAVETLKRFPAIDGVVFDAEMEGTSCAELVKRFQSVKPDAPIIITSARSSSVCGKDAYYVDTHDPARLLEFLKEIAVRPSHKLENREEQLHEEHSPRQRS